MKIASARKVLGCSQICKLAHAFLWEYSHKRLKLAQLLGQLGVFLTFAAPWPGTLPNTGRRDRAVLAVGWRPAWAGTAPGCEAMYAPACIFPQCFFIENVQGQVKITLALYCRRPGGPDRARAGVGPARARAAAAGRSAPHAPRPPAAAPTCPILNEVLRTSTIFVQHLQFTVTSPSGLFARNVPIR
jgi:hypothetical protein